MRHWPALTSLSPSLVHRRCITNSGCSSISARNTHLSSVKISMYIVPCDCIVDSLSRLQPALLLVTCTCVCASHQTVRGFLGASTLTSLKYLALFAVGEVRLVYSRWVISATMWSCCQVGWQSMDSLWITLCVCAWAGHSLEDTYGLSFLCFCASAGAWSNPTKEGIFFFENVYEKPLCFPAGVHNILRNCYPVNCLSSDALPSWISWVNYTLFKNEK